MIRVGRVKLVHGRIVRSTHSARVQFRQLQTGQVKCTAAGQLDSWTDIRFQVESVQSQTVAEQSDRSKYSRPKGKLTPLSYVCLIEYRMYISVKRNGTERRKSSWFGCFVRPDPPFPPSKASSNV